MMSKKDFELVAQVIYELEPVKPGVGLPHISEGNQRRRTALAFARAFEERYPRFERNWFVDRAVHNI